MADESQSPQVALHKPVEISLARARLIWATRPLGFVLLVLWVLHPSVAAQPDHARMALLGFLAGATYGLLIYGRSLREYLNVKQINAMQKPNRVPEEYYWGNIVQTLFDNR